MCDYSLGGLPNRLAVEGEELIVHRFPTQSIGLASPADLEPKPGDAAHLARESGQTTWSGYKMYLTCII